jgi:hypothetical protein
LSRAMDCSSVHSHRFHCPSSVLPLAHSQGH